MDMLSNEDAENTAKIKEEIKNKFGDREISYDEFKQLIREKGLEKQATQVAYDMFEGEHVADSVPNMEASLARRVICGLTMIFHFSANFILLNRILWTLTNLQAEDSLNYKIAGGLMFLFMFEVEWFQKKQGKKERRLGRIDKASRFIVLGRDIAMLALMALIFTEVIDCALLLQQDGKYFLMTVVANILHFIVNLGLLVKDQIMKE